MEDQAKAILDFWFKESDSSKWFNGGDAFDAEITSRFSDVFEKAISGGLASWQDEPYTALAFIILIDQFSRNMFRHTDKMFAADHLALACCKKGIEAGFVGALQGAERLFFIMPLIHSEVLSDQELGLLNLEKYYRDADGYENSRMFYLRHKEIIERFGRFPHRNKVLGRASTDEEVAFLNEPFSSF